MLPCTAVGPTLPGMLLSWSTIAWPLPVLLMSSPIRPFFALANRTILPSIVAGTSPLASDPFTFHNCSSS